MATVVKAEISIKGKRLENFSSLSITQNILSHHTFEVICRPDAFDNFSLTGESFILEKVKDLVGKKIKIDICPIGKDNKQSKTTTIFNGIILEVHGSKYSDAYSGSISLRGASMDVFLDSEHHCRSFEDLKLGDIVNMVLNDYSSNLFEKTTVAANYSETLPYIVQYNETNLDFITRLARTYGEWFLVTGENRLYFGDPPSAKVNVLHGKDLLEISFTMKLASLGFDYKSYNYHTEETITKNSDDYQPNTEGYLKKALNVSEDSFDHDEDIYFISPLSKQAADKEVASAVKIDKQGRVARLNITRGTSDNCEIFLGCILKIDSTVFSQGSSKTMSSGEFRVISLHHVCDDNGNYMNHFEAIPVSAEVPPQSNPHLFPSGESQSAIVTDTNDPDGMGRIRARFFWQDNNDQTPWLRVITPYAGSNKGMFFIPEIGEEVLIGFENSNAQKPFVIGSHFTGKKKPDDWKSDKNLKKAIRTNSGHTIEFNDEGGREEIVIYDKDHINTITLSSYGKQLRIACRGDLDINAQNINITAEKNYTLDVKGKIEITSQKDTEVNASGNCKIKSNKDIEIEAMSNFKAKANSKAEITGTTLAAKGSATAEFSAGGQTVVKGAIVMIN